MKRVLFLIIALFGLYSCSTFTEELENVFEVSAPRLIEAPVEGGAYEVQIQARCSYTFTCNADWVIIPENKETDSTIVLETITVAENKLPVARETKLVIANEYYGFKETITIKQATAGPYIDIPVQSITAMPQGDSIEFVVSANVEYTLASSESWCRLSTTKGKVGDGSKYTLTVDMNKTAESRTASITISNSDYGFSQTITLEQAVANYLTYTSAEKIVPNCAGAKVSVLSHTWESGEGLIVFDGPLTTISDCMFTNCDNLTSVTIPESVTSIGYGAFSGCSSLTSVTIPNSVTSIGKSAFYDCTLLTSITIPDCVTSIGDSAFHDCSSLTRVDITDLYAWCNISFANLSANPLYCAKNLYINGELVAKLAIPSDITEIKSYTFSGCSSLTSVTIPDSVTSIGEEAFYGCSSLSSVVIGKSVASVGYAAFHGCSGLENVTIPNSVTSIGGYAFRDCSSLTSATIPDSVTSIGNSAFSGCSNLLNVNIPNNVASIGDYLFNGCSALEEVTIPESVTSIGYAAFSECAKLESLVIPNSVTSVGGFALYKCSGLKEVTIGENVQTIGEHAFYGCSKLESVYCNSATPPTMDNNAFGSNASNRKFYIDVAVVEAYKAAVSWSIYKSDIVTVYGEEYKLRYTSFNGKIVEPAYAYNTKPFNANIVSNTYENGEGVIIFDAPLTSIGYRSFYFCNTLTSVTIPETVISIGGAAFNGCTSLSNVYCKATTPPQGGYNMFYNSSENLKIYVPTNSVSAYKTPQFWSNYSSKIVGYDF